MCLWLAETVLQLHYRTVLLLQEMSLSMNKISSASVILAREKKGGTASPSYQNCRFILMLLHSFKQIVYEDDFLVW